MALLVPSSVAVALAIGGALAWRGVDSGQPMPVYATLDGPQASCWKRRPAGVAADAYADGVHA
jgi:hypothetical protein